MPVQLLNPCPMLHWTEIISHYELLTLIHNTVNFMSETDYRGIHLKVQELAFLLEKFQNSKPVRRRGCDKILFDIYLIIQMTKLWLFPDVAGWNVR
jgi:hypothetical protein